MNSLLFAKMDQVFIKKHKTLKNYWKNGRNYMKSKGILAVRKSRNHQIVIRGIKNFQYFYLHRLITIHGNKISIVVDY